jgi:isopentenyl diphosphate isomerase/L-lactate dehydrogenase-like FMN-dependent dehydrogenase
MRWSLKVFSTALVALLSCISMADAAKVCKTTNYNSGAAWGPTKATAKAAAMSSWSATVALNNGPKFANWGNATSKSLPCAMKTTAVGANAWVCHAKAKPCAYE